MARFRRILRRLAWALALVLGIVAVHALVAVFPQPLFRHRVTQGNLEVYCTEEMPRQIHAADRAWCKKLGPDDRRSRTLSGSIAHEITHRLIRRRVGWRADRRLPTWVKEGYCDYVARDSAIEVEVGAAILRGEGVPVPGFPSFRARLLIAYLMNLEGLSFVEILARPPDPWTVQRKVTAILARDPAALLEHLEPAG